jgi:hypothetical protein
LQEFDIWTEYDIGKRIKRNTYRMEVSYDRRTN